MKQIQCVIIYVQFCGDDLICDLTKPQVCSPCSHLDMATTTFHFIFHKAASDERKKEKKIKTKPAIPLLVVPL